MTWFKLPELSAGQWLLVLLAVALIALIGFGIWCYRIPIVANRLSREREDGGER
ncbi:MAG: hypothetical protein HY420_00440 [Candidatus Kerfeldbacteria bacterium]|nr:hypothetical protein [Candidatus Kerfeldbacteria bacterium]